MVVCNQAKKKKKIIKLDVKVKRSLSPLLLLGNMRELIISSDGKSHKGRMFLF